jgi:hypothetical protein
MSAILRTEHYHKRADRRKPVSVAKPSATLNADHDESIQAVFRIIRTVRYQ